MPALGPRTMVVRNTANTCRVIGTGPGIGMLIIDEIEIMHAKSEETVSSLVLEW